MIKLLSDPNLWWVLSGTTILGMISGMLGSWAFLRKRGLIGDVIAHSTLPGLCLAFLTVHAKHSFYFLIGATISGLLAVLFTNMITNVSHLKEDTALGLSLSIFFGIGILLLTFIQHNNYGNQSGLDKFIFGQAASIVLEDVKTISIVGLILLTCCCLLYKELKLLCFDLEFGHSLGFAMKKLDFLLMVLLVITIVIGLQTVGVVLMTALIITPAAASRYWTNRLDYMIIVSALIGACSGIIGTFISYYTHHLSTGPIIVIAATILFLISLFFAPKRGLIAKQLHKNHPKKRGPITNCCITERTHPSE